MPTYEYVCPKCKEEFEVNKSIKDENPEACPVCAHSPCKRLISKTDFQLKGTGWAKDGY